jgi:hypothetical protein
VRAGHLDGQCGDFLEDVDQPYWDFKILA